MQENRVKDAFLKVVRIVDPQISWKKIRKDARRLVERSDFYCVRTPPINDEDTQVVADAILDYFTDYAECEDEQFRKFDGTTLSSPVIIREVKFSTHRGEVSRAIEYETFAETWSEDFLYQYSGSRKKERCDVSLICQFLVAICYRYRFCASSGDIFFPSSAILAFVNLASLVESDSHGSTKRPLLVATVNLLGLLEFSTSW